jgi:hypothetical protein
MTAPIETPSPSAVPAWRQKTWVKNALLVAVTAAVAYAMVYVDVLARAREAFHQAEKYERWEQNPEAKKQFYEEKFLKESARLEKRRADGEISAEEYEQDLEILKFDRDQALSESSVKYAYQWYKDTYELFSPPESKWVKAARFRAPAAKQRWREELQSRNIPFEEYMLDLESGEEPGKTLTVWSTRSREKADGAAALLKEKGIVETHVYDAPAHGRLEQEGLKVIVPKEKFWQAHETLKAVIDYP